MINLDVNHNDKSNKNMSLPKKGKSNNNALTCANKIFKSSTFKTNTTSGNNNKGKSPLKKKTFVSISNKHK